MLIQFSLAQTHWLTSALYCLNVWAPPPPPTPRHAYWLVPVTGQGYGLYLAITEFNQGHSLSACFNELALEQLAIKVNPGAAVLPRDWLATRIIGKQSCVDPTHEQGSKLDPSSIQFLNLKPSEKKIKK